MRRSLAVLVALAWAAPARPAEPVAPPPDLAARAWAITDAVLARHVAPPARQQMLLAGVRALNRPGRGGSMPGLAARVSAIEAPGQLAAILAEAWPHYRKDVDVPSPEDAFLDGLLAAVPGGAERLSAKELKVAEQVEGNVYVGIQVALMMDGESKRPSFHQVLPGGPADRAGAGEGDRIEAVDGVPTEGRPLSEVVDRIRGEEGTEVTIRLRKKGKAETSDVPMRRERLPRVTVRGLAPRAGGGWDVRLDGPAPIGYLKLTEVVGSTPQELRAFAAQLESEGARAVVLDLREVSQAGFHPTVLLADALLDGGAIGRVREADDERVIRAEPDALFRDWPIAVLAEGSRSAEVEWLCAALEDNRRASIVGRPAVAPGGGLVRSTVPLPGGEWSLRMATGRLARGDGRALSTQVTRDGDRRRLATTPDLEGYLVVEDPDGPVAKQEPQPADRRRPPGPPADPLARARALLEAALKSPGS